MSAAETASRPMAALGRVGLPPPAKAPAAAAMAALASSPNNARLGPSRAALARVRRDLFGPVDHVAARALAERELRAQAALDAERWGFDFRLEVPRPGSRFRWEALTEGDLVPEPYAFRGMAFLRTHSPADSGPKDLDLEGLAAAAPPPTPTPGPPAPERTPPQEPRLLPPLGLKTTRAREPPRHPVHRPSSEARAPAKQSSITDFMKSRKRSLSTSKKSTLEPAEKVSRNARQIRS